MTREILKAVTRTARKGSSPEIGCFPFGHLIISILRLGKRGLQREMDSFFRETGNEEFNIRRITKSGFREDWP